MFILLSWVVCVLYIGGVITGYINLAGLFMFPAKRRLIKKEWLHRSMLLSNRNRELFQENKKNDTKLILYNLLMLVFSLTLC